MSTLPEQFSAVRKSQIEAQLAFFQNLTTKAVEGAEKIIALNLSTTRASMEKSSAAVRQLFTVKDPRDLFALTTQSQENFDSLMAYSRELFSIASGTQAALLKQSVPAEAPALLPAPSVEPLPEVGAVKPIAKAVAKGVPKPAAAPIPEAEPIVVSGLDPVDAAPPPKPAGDPEQLDILAPKARKKK